MEIEWRPIPGFEGAYEVSRCGRVRSLGRKVVQSNGAWQIIEGTVLVARVDTSGYEGVTLSMRRTRRVHRLVAQVFLAPVPGKDHVNHIDGNKRNNYASNLEWCTRAENAAHAARLGIGSGSTKLTAEDVRQIRSEHTNGTAVRQLARRFNVHRISIRKIIRGETWKHVS